MAVGMDDYLSKPVGLADLDGMLHRWVGRRSSAGAGDPVGQDAGDPLDRSTIAEIRALSGAGGDLLAEIIQVFLEELPDRLRQLRSAVAANDLGEAREAAHALKSASGELGALGLARRCGEVERRGAAGRPGDLPEALGALEAEAERVRVALVETLLERPAPCPDQAPSRPGE